MENALNQSNITPTFQSKDGKTQKNPLMGNALQLQLHDQSSLPKNRGTRRKRREIECLKAEKKDKNQHLSTGKEEEQQEEEDVDDEEDDEKVEVKRKIVALQRIVPGGESLGVDKLFEETAGYILNLQCQIKAMKVLTSLIEGLEKQKTKLGG